MDFAKGVLPHKILTESESIPVELTRLSTSSWPPWSLAVLRETKQPRHKEGLHVDWEKKKRKKTINQVKSIGVKGHFSQLTVALILTGGGRDSWYRWVGYGRDTN